MAIHVTHFRDIEKKLQNVGVWFYDLFHDELFWLYVMLAVVFLALSILIWAS